MVNLALARGSFHIHSHNVESTRFTSTIWSKQTKDFAFSNTESVSIDGTKATSTISIDFHQILGLNEVINTVTLAIPDLSCLLCMLFNILTFREKLQLDSLVVSISTFVAINYPVIKKHGAREDYYELTEHGYKAPFNFG